MRAKVRIYFDMYKFCFGMIADVTALVNIILGKELGNDNLKGTKESLSCVIIFNEDESLIDCTFS